MKQRLRDKLSGCQSGAVLFPSGLLDAGLRLRYHGRVGPSVYIETMVISYLTARPSKDLVQRAHRRLTRTWWQTRRSEFDLYAAPLVLQEAAAGNPARAQGRVRVLGGLPNARMRSKIEALCRVEGCEPPVLCTPEELMED